MHHTSPVNIGSLGPRDYIELANIYRRARFIITEGAEGELTGLGEDGSKKELNKERYSADEGDGVATPRPPVDELRQTSRNVLVLPAQHPDKWESLCGFLGWSQSDANDPVDGLRPSKLLDKKREPSFSTE